MKSTEDVTKLPRWAQSRIQKLERDVDYYQRKLSAGPENSDTFADAYSDARRPLGPGTIVEFRLPEGRVRIRTDEHGYLDVNGDDRIQIEPQASNAVRVMVKP